MKGVVLALCILVAAAANARESRLPVPPVPPAGAPLLAAPVPDLNMIAQNDEPRQSNVTLFLGINHRTAPTQGFGYAAGAHYQIDNDRRWFVLPGVMVRVPLP